MSTKPWPTPPSLFSPWRAVALAILLGALATAVAPAGPAAAAAALAETEPNDVAADADSLGAGALVAAYPPAGAGALIEGELAPGDVDQFSFTLGAGELVAVAVLTADGGNFSDPTLRLVGPSSAPVATDDDSGPGFLPALRRRADQAGVWRVAVSGFGDADFDGAGHGESFAYRLVVSVVAAPPLFVEPLPDANGSAAEADPLPQVGATFGAGAPGGVAAVTGAIAPGDVDFYTVPVRPGDPFAALVWEEGAGAFADPVLGLVAGPGPDVRDDDDAGPGFLPAILTVAPVGSTTAALAVSGFRDVDFSGGAHDETFSYHLVVAQPPFADVDGDGVSDAIDNCPYRSNPSQVDRGGIGDDTQNGIGDACECGDVNGDGMVTLLDAMLYQRALLIPPSAEIARPELCNVGGTPQCTLADAGILRRAFLSPPAATIQPVCAASVAP